MSEIRAALDPARLAAVTATGLLDTTDEEGFDRISSLARRLLHAPFAFLTVVDDRRSFWKSRQGLAEDAPRQNTLQESFCQYVVDSGEPLVLDDVRLDERTRDNPSIQSMGVVAWAGFPVLTPDGHVLGTLCAVDTVAREWTPEQVASLADLAAIASREVALRVAAAEAEAARAHAALLGRIGELLVAGLDLPAVWSAVARLAVPALGDHALVYSVERGGTLLPRAVVHRDPGRQAELSAATASTARHVRDTHGPGAVAASGKTQVQVDLSGLADLTPEQEYLRDTFGAVRSVTVPLRAKGELIGVLNVVRTADSAAYTDDDVALVESIASRAALALDNALSFDLERNLSLHLQRALLPPLLPQPDHLHIVTRYQPAGRGQLVGGDWYDAFLDRCGLTNLVIGDVAGHDIAAATTMGQLRTMFRTFAHDGQRDPAEVLTAIDASLGALGDPVFATALLARIDRFDHAEPARRREVTWSSAGHLPALLLTVDGSVRLLEVHTDPPLGLGPELTDALPGRRSHTAVLPPAATLVLYTDGLVERRGEDLDDGLRRLLAAAQEYSDLPLDEFCDSLIEAVDGDGDDDVALIAVRAFPEDEPRPAEAGPTDTLGAAGD
ncbi:SpoIIE family protein phosphatase [Blastococcus sp. URHD0036]|uniref:SpoIIE family protein phosphatase n=1 Tax=Blastococcus sp. URHD0036 TaxID=1380356 RepID=UPI0006908F60|nr:SpoIIE family protein phosphatase [Blastococcus sp. URHD0036]